MDDLREVMAASVGESARFNKRHRCTRPEMPAAMCAQIAEDALAAIKQAGFVVVPVEPTEAMLEAGGGEETTGHYDARTECGMVGEDAARDVYSAMIEASNAPT